MLVSEAAIRLGVFLGVFAVMAVWETAAPKLRRPANRVRRWSSNLGVSVINTLLLRLAAPLAAGGVALFAEARGWGLFNALDAPAWLAFAASLLLLDLTIYFQHRLFHAVPLFWRAHRMHHADTILDVTSGVRFHQLEIGLSMVIKAGAIIALGAPVLAVLVFEVLLNATSMFNHSNVRMPAALDRVLRLVVVTPEMHRVHHSILPYETNSNFGFNAPWWDRLFGTYRAQPEAGHEKMTIGLSQFRDPRELWLDRLLTQPLRESAAHVPLGERERPKQP
jgi:sterol desaturase/sphingolipid hydroxylase (fatty acid hydroxylase superfamily)